MVRISVFKYYHHASARRHEWVFLAHDGVGPAAARKGLIIFQRQTRQKHIAIGSCGRWTCEDVGDGPRTIEFKNFACDDAPNINRHELLWQCVGAFSDGRSVTWLPVWVGVGGDTVRVS